MGNLVVGTGFEPVKRFRVPILQTGAINHSATPPGEPTKGLEPPTCGLQNRCSAS